MTETNCIDCEHRNQIDLINEECVNCIRERATQDERERIIKIVMEEQYPCPICNNDLAVNYAINEIIRKIKELIHSAMSKM